MRIVVSWFLLATATLCGIGALFSRGQGPIAGFVALGILPFFLRTAVSVQLVIVCAAFLLGVIASRHAEAYFEKKDDHRIVIDEVVSILISFIGIAATAPLILFAVIYLLNSIIDHVKPFGIGTLERLDGGWGVMLDDAVVGLMCLVLAHALARALPITSTGLFF